MSNSCAMEAAKSEKAIANDSSVRMPCMEVWSGSQLATSAVEFGGLDCWIYSRPYASACGGGDVYYLSSCATGRIIRLLLADVAGHGAVVAGIADQLRGLMRRFVNRLDHGEFVRVLNKQFAAHSAPDKFATAVVATFFVPSRRLRLSNAGHPRPLLFRAATGQWQLMGNGGLSARALPANLPLGIFAQTDYEHFDIEMQPGDCVLAYTDAVSESCDADGALLDEAGLLEALRRSTAERVAPADLIGWLTTEISGCHPANLCADDVTLLLIRANGREPSHSIRDRLGAVLRFLGALVRMLHPKSERPPFPDLLLANIGGVLFPALARRWRAQPEKL